MSIERKKDKRELLPTDIWVDYVENEVDPTFKKDLELVIQNNPQYKKILKDLKTIKDNLQDKVKKTPSDEIFLKLKSNIMKEIDSITPEKQDYVIAAQSELRSQISARRADAVKLAKKLGTKVGRSSNKSKHVI